MLALGHEAETGGVGEPLGDQGSPGPRPGSSAQARWQMAVRE